MGMIKQEYRINVLRSIPRRIVMRFVLLGCVICLSIFCVKAQPLLYFTCLSDDAVMSGKTCSTTLATTASFIQDTIQTPIPNSTCSYQFALLNYQGRDLPIQTLHTALKAYDHARAQGYDPQQILTIVDYSKPSSSKRLWVFDLKQNKLIYHSYVSHGTQSGTLYASRFSDKDDSHESVLGVILTGEPYEGTLGYSLRLYGLEKGFNTNIYKRRIVVHSAWYVTPDFISRFHEAGKSFGCLAISPDVGPNVINYIKEGSIIVNYFPSKSWLEHSQFLNE